MRVKYVKRVSPRFRRRKKKDVREADVLGVSNRVGMGEGFRERWQTDLLTSLPFDLILYRSPVQ